jgi:hypothetical protein
MTRALLRVTTAVVVIVVLVIALAAVPNGRSYHFPRTPNYAYTQSFMLSELNSIDKYWDRQWRGDGLTQNIPNPSYAVIMPGQRYVSNCWAVFGEELIVTYDYPNAFFCVADGPNGTIILPVGTFQNFLHGDAFGRIAPGIGYWTMSVVLAHEYGHYAQFIFSQDLHFYISRGMNMELMADCFSGNWDRSTSPSAEQYGQAVAIYSVIGDNSGSHGTSAERLLAFDTGIQSQPHTCLDRYQYQGLFNERLVSPEIPVGEDPFDTSNPHPPVIMD